MPKIAKGLTDKDVLNAKPKKSPYKLYDRDGLCVFIRTTGTKVWQYHYQYQNQRKTFTIGRYLSKSTPGHISLKEARLEKHKARELLSKGIDPNVYKQENANGKHGDENTTFEALGREWHDKGTWARKHGQNILRSLENDVFTLIGRKHIKDVTRQDIIAVLVRIEDREAYDVAKRVCNRCEAIFDYAITKGVCDDNPALGRAKFIKKVKSQPRPHLREDQLPEFLFKLSNYHGREYVKYAMQLLCLTFLRPGELRTLEWGDVNFETALIKIPAERMKMNREHSVPLSRQAMELLKELRKVTGNNELLFPSVKNNGKSIADVTLTKVLHILGHVKDSDKHAVPHGFRHTASTILNEKGFNFDHIEKQLAHIDSNKVRGTYNQAVYLEDRHKMMQWWADHLDNLKEQY